MTCGAAQWAYKSRQFDALVAYPNKKRHDMSYFNTHSSHSHHSLNGGSIRLIGSVCQHLLNIVAEAAARASERSRYAALPRRYLDDVGMTIAERDAALR